VISGIDILSFCGVFTFCFFSDREKIDFTIYREAIKLDAYGFIGCP